MGSLREGILEPPEVDVEDVVVGTVVLANLAESLGGLPVRPAQP